MPRISVCPDREKQEARAWDRLAYGVLKPLRVRSVYKSVLNAVGDTCYIDNAEYFAELGTIIDDDFDNQVVATLAYRLAWLHAYYATQ